MSPKRSCPKRVQYRTAWLGLLIITMITAVLMLGFSSLAVHMPNQATKADDARGSDASRTRSNLISGLAAAGSRGGSPIVIDSAPNMRLEALPASSSMAAPLPPPKANIDQIRNGSAAAPTNPAAWVNGNAGASQAHYREGYSIAYRLVLTGLPVGAHEVQIEWDIRHSSRNAIDYITYFDRINSPSHLAVFGHVKETIDPAIGVAGLGAPNTATSIPAPPVSSTAGTVGGLAQPTTSFSNLPANEQKFTIYNGTINAGGLTYINNADGNLGNLTAASSSTRLKINFQATNANGTVVLAWGGHIASAQDWGPNASASSVSGSPYHTRLISLDGAGGNQDRSLAAGAVIVDCATCSVGAATTAACGTTKTHTATIDAGGVCDTPGHSWSFVSNTSGASFVGATNGASVTVNVGNACSGSYTVRDTITCSGCTGASTIVCDQAVTVSDTTAPVIGSPGNNGSISCPNAPAFTPPTATDNCDLTPTIQQVSDVTTPTLCAGVYSRTVTWRAVDDCNNASGNVSQTINVVDTTAPSIGSPGQNATIECPAEPNFTPPSVSDTCGGATLIEVSDVTTPGSCAGSYTRTKTWKARDCVGNESSTVSQTITVQDTTAPSIGSPGANATIDCPAEPTFTPPTATDTCDASPTIEEVSDETTPGSCAGEYTRTKTWRAVDDCGNPSNTVSQTISVVDNTDPVISCPDDIVVECLDDVPPAATTLEEFELIGGSASDTCGVVTISSSDAPGDFSSCGSECGGKITRTYTATDECGNSASCDQIITYGTPGTAQSAQAEVIAGLLKSGDLTVGLPGRSLTIKGGLNAKSSALCLVTKLSASGSASSLAGLGDRKLDPATCQTSPTLELQNDGTWRNVALSQAISLALNLRLSAQQEQLKQQAKASGFAAALQVGRPDADFDLGSFALTATLSTRGALPGPDGLRGTFDDELDLSSARLQLAIPASVLSALGPNAKAGDLLKLANAELAGVSTSDVKLSDIAAALDAVNRSFDFGKRRLVLDK